MGHYVSKDELRHQKGELEQLQALPLRAKVLLSKQRIREWYDHFNGEVCVSFSGGKDSTALLHLVRSIYPDVPGMFVDTGLEYPEIREHVHTFENIDIVRPKMNFRKVLEKYGYPVISKEVARTICYAQKGREWAVNRCAGVGLDGEHRFMFERYQRYAKLVDAPFKVSDECCAVMKKATAKKYQKETGRAPMLGIMAEESLIRQQSWQKYGCNAFEMKVPISRPLSFWTDQDVLQYTVEEGVPLASIYGEIVFENGRYTTTGMRRTGCMFCMFGAHLEKYPNRFQKMKYTHPKQWAYCMKPWEEGGLGMAEVLDFIGVPWDTDPQIWDQPEPEEEEQ